jgi:arylsulfatase A-like enzyme
MGNRNKPSQAKVGLDIRDSTPDWTPFQPPEAKKGSPNVLYIVWDDTGVAAWECFGGLISTPNIDRIVKKGLRYTNWHTTALCSPSRSCFMTGRNHHMNNMSAITECASGFRGSSGVIPPENGMISEMLLDQGYSTYCLGKWHLTPETESNMAASHRTWPLGRGFERFYGFLGAETNQWYPDLTYDNHPVDQPSSPQEGYHLSKDLVDRTIEFIRDGNQIAPQKPWFTYLAFGANHAPHQVPKEWADKYKGKFDMGYEKYREITVEKMKKLGVVPKGTQLSPINPWPAPEVIYPADVVLPWDTLNADQKKLFARMAEVYAGFCTYTDFQLGRLLDYLEESGQFDNTLFIVVSDNGASGEGTPNGSVNENNIANMWPDDLKENLKMLDALGSPLTYNHYPTGWAWAFNAPAKMFKRYTLEGGIADPLVIAWPEKMKKVAGQLRDQYHHAIDIVPTIMECTETEAPEFIKGYYQSEIQGVSMCYSFEDAKAPTTRTTQYYEMLGSRAIYHDGWKAVSRHGPDSGHGHFENDPWELYHIAEDRSESTDLAAKYPERVQAMISLWFVEAGKNHVFPLDDRTALEILTTERPSVSRARESYVYYPGTAAIPEGICPNIRNRSFAFQDVIFSQGSKFGGQALYVKDGKLHFVNNFIGHEEQRFVASEKIGKGDFTVLVDFEKTGENPKFTANGKLTLSVNKKTVAEGKMRFQPGKFGIASSSMSIGRANADAVSSDYQPPFEFKGGTIRKVIVTPQGEGAIDVETDAKMKFSAA